MTFGHTKEISEKHLKAIDKAEKSKNKEALGDTAKAPVKKCFYENNGSCRDQDKCSFYHPKKTCQSHSKLGSCPQESLCEHRHPQKVCSRLLSSGYCSSGDRCRSRHPLEYAFNDYSQSTWRKSKHFNNNFNCDFLGSSPHSLQGPGVDQAFPSLRAAHSSAPREPWSPPFQAGTGAGPSYPGLRASHQSTPREPWSPPFQAGAGQGGHPQVRGDHHQAW